MVKVLKECDDLKEHTLLQCTADGALFDSRLVEVERQANGEARLLAMQVADTPPRPAAKVDEEDFGHYADWWKKYTKKNVRVLSSGPCRSAAACAKSDEPFVGVR